LGARVWAAVAAAVCLAGAGASAGQDLGGLRRQAEGGDAAAQTALGKAYETGGGVPRDPAEAVRWYRRAADQGWPEAEGKLGILYFRGLGVAADQARAIEWTRRAAEHGDPRGQNNLGVFYALGAGGLPRDAAQAAAWFQRAADQGFPQAFGGLGILYRDGAPGLAADPPHAAALFRRGAELGEVNSQVNLGAFYEHGQGGLAANLASAAEFYRKAADQGDATGQYNLARLVFEGVGGVKKDEAEAVRLLRQASDQGMAEARALLGYMYGGGRGGLPRDWGAAFELTAQAAEQGYAPAEARLGGQYEGGLGVARDYGRAAYWYRRAVQHGSDDARQYLADLLARHPGLSAPPAQVAKAAPPPPMPAPPTAAEPARGGPRIALVIGNSAYGGDLGRLSNPANDARLIAEALRRAGFEVELLVDADQKAMKRAIQRLGQRLTAGGAEATGLFYYAGHGAQSGGVNFLVPVGAALQSESDLDIEAVSADSVLGQMDDSGAATTILILDSCRNMPLTRRTRDGTRGLVRMNSRNKGSYIAYSTAPGAVALDGQGADSPFALALAAEIPKPGQPIEITFRNVARAVDEATQGAQTPWTSTSLLYDFSFTPAAAP
jgi:TPR repeat protein